MRGGAVKPPLFARLHWYVLAPALAVLFFAALAVGDAVEGPASSDPRSLTTQLTAAILVLFISTVIYPILRRRVLRARVRRGATLVDDDGGHANGTFLFRATWANFLFPGAGLLLLGRPRQAQPYLWIGAAIWGVLLPSLAFAGYSAVFWLPVAYLFGLAAYTATTHAYLQDHIPQLLEDELRRELMMPGRTTCPRCRERERGASGWCADCEAALAPQPLPAEHPVVRSVQATNDDDPRGIAAVTAYPYWAHNPDGERIRMRRGLERILLAGMHRSFTQARTTLEAAYLDPADPDTTWCRMRFVGVRADAAPIERHHVAQYRTEGDRIREIWNYPSLSETDASSEAQAASAAPPAT